mgnify:CR=1 FL=1
MMGNSHVEDLIRSLGDDERFSDVDVQIMANRLLPQPTKEERRTARDQVIAARDAAGN